MSRQSAAFNIHEHENAFTFFRRANDKLTPCPLSPSEERSAAIVAWSEADPKLRAWVEANRPALELFQRGAERPDGISRRPGEPYSGRHSEDLGPHHLTLLALVEGGRRAEGGDMAGAWDCYRAVLRATVFAHVEGSSSSVISPASTTAGCGIGWRPGRPTPGPRSRSSDAPWGRRSRADRGPNGMPFRSSWNISTG